MMPLAEIRNIDKGKLGIWKLNETVEELSGFFYFSEQEEREYLQLKNATRKKEYLTVRLLLEQMLGHKDEIIYHSGGWPELKSSKLKISVSHSSDLAVVLLLADKSGVDVENINRNAMAVASRFLSTDEYLTVENATSSRLLCILYWCAKEAAYKFSQTSGIDFKTRIVVHPFSLKPEGGEFTGELFPGASACKLNFNYLFFENNVIVSCVEEAGQNN